MATNNSPVTGDTLISIKITVNDSYRRIKLPFKDLGADVLPGKLRQLLGSPPEQTLTLERFSDSAGGYVTLDASNPSAFKTLVRAAKAKQKLRLKASFPTSTAVPESASRSMSAHMLAKIAQAQQPTIEELFARAHKMADNLPKLGQPPVIARTPNPVQAPRDSTAMDGRSIGPGIFDFKNDRTGKDTKKYNDKTISQVIEDLAKCGIVDDSVTTNPTWSVYCNSCDAVMLNTHFHCSVCDGGDYDLCESCVNSGKLCEGEGHWLVKRSIKDGTVVSSTTETLPSKKLPVSPKTETVVKTEVPIKSEEEKEVPGAFMDDTKTLNEQSLAPVRTCNCCISVKPDEAFVTCKVCDDYDLCLSCHAGNKHGHNPAHDFNTAVGGIKLDLLQQSLLPAGRNTRHAAICDGCNTNIYGVRHKCFNCPDFDYCNKCVKQARVTHPQHRFAPIYEPIAMSYKPAVRHHGIYCDGPACSSKPHQNYIHGVRYKCVVCHDTDFCADCEAMPGNGHNQTHPLIKIKTPIRGLNVSTVNETAEGPVNGLGDMSAVHTTTPRTAHFANTTSSVQTVAEIKPTTVHEAVKPTNGSHTAKSAVSMALSRSAMAGLHAHYVEDTVRDGMQVQADTRFTQVWTLRNPGPATWPSGCSVRFVGGDNMLNLDNNHTSTASEVAEATESNVIGREVQPGEQVAFKVIMKAPTRAGKAISYWRIKAADGTPFGHRLWCDINVFLPINPPVMKLPALLPHHTSQLMDLERRNKERLLRAQQEQVSASRAADPHNPPPYFQAAQSYYKQYQERMKAMRTAHQEYTERANGYTAPFVVPPPPDMFQQRASQSTRAAFADQSNWRKQMEDFVSASTSSPMLYPAAQQKSVQTETKELADRQPMAEQESGNLKTSQMVFPTLEKESPSNSTSDVSKVTVSKGKAASVEDEADGTISVAAKSTPGAATPSQELAPQSDTGSSEAPSAEADGFDDIADDLEVLSAGGDTSDDDGFLTDEEWDVLDASDQETVVSSK